MIQLISPLHTETLSCSLPLLPPDAQVVQVMTGGTEGLFLEKVQSGEIDLTQPVCLVASGQSNSLAASLEILSYINQHGGRGEVLC